MNCEQQHWSLSTNVCYDIHVMYIQHLDGQCVRSLVLFLLEIVNDINFHKF